MFPRTLFCIRFHILSIPVPFMVAARLKYRSMMIKFAKLFISLSTVNSFRDGLMGDAGRPVMIKIVVAKNFENLA